MHINEKKMKRISAYLTLLSAALAAVVSCEDTSGVLEELGLPEAEYTVGSSAGILSVEFYANSKGSITVPEGVDWIRLEKDTFDSDGVLKVAYEDNVGFPRMARLVLSLDRNPDYLSELVIRQEGDVQPYLTFPRSAISLYNGGEPHVKIEFETNVPHEQISMTTRIMDGGQEWISGVALEEGGVGFDVVDNQSQNKRTAVITFSYDDGWGGTVAKDVHIIQAGCDNSFGEAVTFEQLRQAATTEGLLLTGGVLEAHVVSDKASGNVNENTQQSAKSIDYTVCRRSAYIQSLDGRFGFLILTDKEEDNVFEMNTKVRIDLSNVLVKRYDTPERYVLENVTVTSLLETEDASGQIPAKLRSITELTDEDIYTRVTLHDVEWPVRKGSLTPCYEFMTNACNNDSATKFATLLRGSDGGSMYIYTNTTCPYRRDGSRMGYGSGTMTGVIVHEKHRPFNDHDAATEAEFGYIGDYQIRHMSKDDLGFADSFEDSFSEMICEFRYVLPDKDYYLLATYGEGRISHTGPYSSSYSEDLNGDGIREFSYGFRGLTYYDFSYLGPVGNNSAYVFGDNRGNTNGFGIILEDGTDYGLTDGSAILANTDGRGRTNRLNEGNLAWGAVKWWNSSYDRPYFWLAEFSTAGIQTDCLSLQLQMLNQCQKGRSPRYWKVEWALHGNTEVDEGWSAVGDVFTVPDVIPDNVDPATWMSAAFKPMDFRLPLEMLGHEKVYIRIGPASNKASDLYGYDNTTISADNYSGGTMNYFAVRYNK